MSDPSLTSISIGTAAVRAVVSSRGVDHRNCRRPPTLTNSIFIFFSCCWYGRYHDTVDDAWLKLEWESISQEKEVIPSTSMFHFEHVVDSPFNATVEPSTTHPPSCIVYGEHLETVSVFVDFHQWWCSTR